jgi:hypothetical protein
MNELVKRNARLSAPRLLGAMFVVVAVLSLLSGQLLSPLSYSLAGPSGDVSETMTAFAEHPTMVWMSITGFLIEAVAIVLLTVLLYSLLKEQNRILARWAFGLWLIEAVGVALRQFSAFSLLRTGQMFVEAGAPESSYFQILGSLHYDLMHFGYDAQMLFYCVGGLLFYSLFFRSRYVPRAVSVWGIVVAALALVGELFALFGFDVPLYVYLPVLPFELFIGVWLMITGVRYGSEIR